jgi:hypothetical protein
VYQASLAFSLPLSVANFSVHAFHLIVVNLSVHPNLANMLRAIPYRARPKLICECFMEISVSIKHKRLWRLSRNRLAQLK